MATKKKVAACPSKGTTKKISGKSFKLDKTAKTKTEAVKAAKAHREGGKTKLARVVKTACGFEVWKRG